MKTNKRRASPETDKEQVPVAKAWEAWIEGRDPRDESMVVPADLARRLEQERDDARRIADKLRKAAWKVANIYSSSQLEKARQELEDLL
jgi:hypothetical protein